jgi:proline dehydrogenase
MGTHDPVLCRRLLAELRRRQVPPAHAEFAMLYGIQRPLQLELVQSGYPMRVLVAYGEYWFPWYMRRLAERPANVWFVLKNLAG